MSVPFQKDNFFCLFGKIWIKMPPLSSGVSRNSYGWKISRLLYWA